MSSTKDSVEFEGRPGPEGAESESEPRRSKNGNVGAGAASVARIAGAGPAWQPSWGPRSGEASYYGTSRRGDHSGDGFAFQKMANGQPMNPQAMIAAHQHLPLGTRVRVHRGGNSIVVTIADRGPYAHNRILDLSPAAAELLGIVQAGHGSVTLDVLDLG